jgi:hypothetical protein
MAFTIARTAGRLATSPSRILVATDPKRIELHLDADPRFAAAAGGTVRCLAEFAGMPEDVCREFQDATIRACLEAFQLRPTARHIIEFCRFENRVEVIVDPNVGAAAIRLTRSVNSHS